MAALGLGRLIYATHQRPFDFRLPALARLEQAAALRGWSLPRLEAGSVSLALDVLKAAAEVPLIEDAEGQAAFDEDAFQRRMLATAEPDGRA